MVRETHPHEVFVRIVRSAMTGDGARAGDDSASAEEQVRVARFIGASELPAAPATGTLAQNTLVGFMLGEGSRFVLASAAGHSSTLQGVRLASRMRFSFSRADGIAACAVSSSDPVGVAVESVRRIGPDPLGVSAAICSEHERSILEATPASARPWRLLVMWTLKEAIAKAIGLGVRFPLQRIAVGNTGAISTHMLDSLHTDPMSEWRFATWRPAPSHVVAVAVRSLPGTHLRFGGDLSNLPAGATLAPDAAAARSSANIAPK
jgi:4'-phosphopantetheinyl transferase